MIIIIIANGDEHYILSYILNSIASWLHLVPAENQMNPIFRDEPLTISLYYKVIAIRGRL
jgi:hypothetical protein